jgi:hypothetical protein
MQTFKPSKAAWAFVALAGLMIAIKLLFDFYPYDFPARDQASAFTWPVVLGIIALGAMGFAADRALGMPEPFTDAERDRAGLWISIGLGFAYGVFTVVDSLIGGERHPYINATDWPHVLLPWSIPFYLFGAILLEFMLRLGLLCVLVWVLHVVVLRRHFRLALFWIVACVVATYEIIPYVMEDIAAQNWGAVALSALQPLYWTNVLEAWLLLRYGWITPIVFRAAFYLIWHVLHGGLAPSFVG